LTEQVEKILGETSVETFTTVARGVLEDPTASLAETPNFNEITVDHNDKRTIGLFIVTGEALSSGKQQSWSAVLKLIDPSETVGSGLIESELQVYESGIFSSDAVPFRSAKFYHSESLDNGMLTLWLEDLSESPQPPWNLEQFTTAANHIGQFNGYHYLNKTEVPFDILSNRFVDRLNMLDFRSDAVRLVEEHNSTAIRAAYSSTPVETATRIAELTTQLIEVGKSLPHSLAFGDSHPRNLFPVESGTVGIDWGTTTMDPIGADAGMLTGPSLTLGIDEANLIIQNERAIFESYVGGLSASGWSGDQNDVRLGYLCSFINFLNAVNSFLVNIPNYESRREWVERRLKAPFDEIPNLMSPIVAEFPKYADELEQLLN